LNLAFLVLLEEAFVLNTLIVEQLEDHVEDVVLQNGDGEWGFDHESEAAVEALLLNVSVDVGRAGDQEGAESVFVTDLEQILLVVECLNLFCALVSVQYRHIEVTQYEVVLLLEHHLVGREPILSGVDVRYFEHLDDLDHRLEDEHLIVHN
jgi:hypothetical protein